MICHGVLYQKWVSTGNFSNRVLSALVKRCLEATEKSKLTSIAFPSLGTGKLGYPYLQVARTMVRAVNDYGRHFPDTGIQKVHFTLQEPECIEAFRNVLESDSYEQENLTQIEDVFTIQDYWFLDTKVQEQDLVIQLMADDDSSYTNEPTEARLKWCLKETKEKGRGSPVHFSWCAKKGCYTRELNINRKESTDLIKDLALQSFQVLEKKKISSVLIDIRDLTEGGAANALYEAFKELMPSSAPGNTSVSGSAERYLRKMKIFVNKSEFSQLMGEVDGRQADSEFAITKFISKLQLIKKDKVVYAKSRRRVDRVFTCCIFGNDGESMKKAFGDLQRHLETKVKTQGHFCVCDHQTKQWMLLSSYNNAIVMDEEGNSVDIDRANHQFNYNIEDMVRTRKSGERHYEEMVFIEGVCEMPEKLQSPVWCVFQEDKYTWRFLDAETNKVLNKTVDQRGMYAESRDEDGKSFHYDLNNMVRHGQEQRNRKEAIRCIAGVEDNNHTSHSFQTTSRMDESTVIAEHRNKEANFPIFDVVVGKVSCNGKNSKKKILEICESVGCRATSDEQSVLEIQGTFSQVNEANDKLKNEFMGKGDESFQGVTAIPMTECDYKAFLHFGRKAEWFKDVENFIDYDKDTMSLITSKLEDLSIEKKMKDLLATIKGMASEHFVITTENKSKVAEFQQKAEATYPNVCLFIKDNDIEIISENYPELQQVKRLFDQTMYASKNQAKPKGSRAGRRFNKTEPEPDVYTGHFEKPDELSRPKPTSTYSLPHNSNVVVKNMDSGLVIKIYTDSITKLNVDCIVNAANDRLMHGGGVAYAISEAAGYEFDRESAEHVAKYGPIAVGKCCVTRAGKLHYQCVIHTVGPKWIDYGANDKELCLDDLQEAVEVTFREADERGMKSVALPAISSGIFGVPKEKCVEQYKKAVLTFDARYPRKSLQEIHFVDRDPSMVTLMQAAFSEMSAVVTQRAKSRKRFEKTEDQQEYSSQDSQLQEQYIGTQCSTIRVSESVLVRIMIGDIAECHTDGIVCPQDEYCKSKGQIARSILSKVPDDKKDSMIPPMKEKRNVGDIIPILNNCKSVPWTLILHVVSPRWNREAQRAPRNYEASLKTVTKEVLEIADNKALDTVAFPLLGTGEKGNHTPLETCARMFCEAVGELQSRFRHLKEINVIAKEESVAKAYLNALERIQNPTSATNKSVSSKNWAKTIKGSELPTEDEKCCICMDTPTNPQRLEKCGHVFCKECIKQCFKYKPACPNCGQIYGKMTGDQPEGSILFKRGYKRLEGFHDCTDCIIVTYTFSNGKQGPDHPHPGKWYKGISRSGYVPDNEKGHLVAKLLNVAFSRRLVFTIGHSRTTGQDGVITWNDIHHKTRPDGGPQKFGYPDNTYLDRVLEELAAKGVTPESADDAEEYSKYSQFIRMTSR